MIAEVFDDSLKAEVFDFDHVHFDLDFFWVMKKMMVMRGKKFEEEQERKKKMKMVKKMNMRKKNKGLNWV